MSTAKVVVVDPSANNRDAFASALAEAGYEVAVAPSGSYALTMLECERPELVISAANIGDMDGYELFVVMRRDPTTATTPFLLLAGRDRASPLVADEAGVNMTVTGDLTCEIVVDRTGALLAQRSKAQASHSAAPGAGVSVDSVDRLLSALHDAQPAGADETAVAVIQGSLSAITVSDVVSTIATSGNTGCLILSSPGQAGSVLFDRGRVVHAAYNGQAGQMAFHTIASSFQADSGARFRFSPAHHDAMRHLPKTIC